MGQFPAPRLSFKTSSDKPDWWDTKSPMRNFRIRLFKKIIQLPNKKDKLFFISIILTLPSILIWSFGTISYLWSLVYKYIFINLSLKLQMLLLLIIPFTASTLSLIDFIRTRSHPSKILFILNLFSIVMVIFTSLLLG